METPEPFDDYWMMNPLGEPEDRQEETEDPPSAYPPGYDSADYFEDQERIQRYGRNQD